MIKYVRRISQTLALILVYLMCAYGYMTTKGFIIKDGTPILSNVAHAKDGKFSHKVVGEVMMNKELRREKGNKNAPITVYIYSSMICSHCNNFHRFTLPKIKRDFVDTGKIKYVLIQMPYDSQSMLAAKLAYSLPPEKYEDFITKLYKSRDWLFSNDGKKLEKYALEFGLTQQKIKSCIEDKKLTSDIILTRDAGAKIFGITGTPAFVVETAKGKELIEGAQSYDNFKDYFEKIIKG